MKMTIGNILDKVDAMRRIVYEIEGNNSVDYRMNEIADLLDEYMAILLNTTVDI